jgi:ornithine carbamoyltransferase
LQEHTGGLDGRKLAYVGDANNVARSLAMACGRLGVRMALAAPAGYQFADAFMAHLKSEVPDLQLDITEDPAVAVADADAVYTDVWASMGQESEKQERQRVFADYQVNAALMAGASDDACFLHCLPANRGYEVTDEVMDGPASAVVQQAANRMHVQKGILAWLLAAQA